MSASALLTILMARWLHQAPGLLELIGTVTRTSLVAGLAGLAGWYVSTTIARGLASGAGSALAQLAGGGHFSFSDFCEVPREILAFMGGFEEACEPRHLPWRHAQDIVKYLSLSFFDGILNDNGDALTRLAPANLATIEDLAYQSK